MNRCLSDADIQALIDGELAPDRAGHLAECAGCANRTDARRRAIEPLLSLTRQAGVPPARLDAMRTRAAASDGLVAELSSLKEERDVIRTRVTDMLDQLEALNL